MNKETDLMENAIRRTLRPLTNRKLKKHKKDLLANIGDNNYELQFNFIVMTSEFTTISDMSDRLSPYLGDIQKKVLDKATKVYRDILLKELKYAFPEIALDFDPNSLYNYPLSEMDQIVFDDLQEAQLCGAISKYFPRHPGVRNVGYFRQCTPECQVVNSPVHVAADGARNILIPEIERAIRENDISAEADINEGIDLIIIEATKLLKK